MIEDLISMMLPFCETSLSLKNRQEESPVSLIKQVSLKQIFSEHYDDLFIQVTAKPAKSSQAEVKKVSSGSSSDPVDVFDEFSKTKSSEPKPLNLSMQQAQEK
jgi:hypothetical protein